METPDFSSLELTKKDRLTHDDHLEDLKDKHRAVCRGVDAFNSTIDRELEELNTLVKEYNAAVDAANEFAVEMGEHLREEFIKLDESLQETEIGEEADNTITTWSDFDGERLDEYEADELDQPDKDTYNDFKNLSLGIIPPTQKD